MALLELVSPCMTYGITPMDHVYPSEYPQSAYLAISLPLGSHGLKQNQKWRQGWIGAQVYHAGRVGLCFVKHGRPGVAWVDLGLHFNLRGGGDLKDLPI